MELQYKQDFETVRRQWQMFWSDSNSLEYPMIHAIIPKAAGETGKWPPKLHGDENPDEVAEKVDRWASTHDFLGGAIPFFSVQFGPMHFAGLLGCELLTNQRSKSTTWTRPFVADWDKTELHFREDGEIWEKTVFWIRELRKRLDGKVIVAGPTLSGNLDALASVRGVEELLMDLIAQPDAVHNALRQVTKAHKEVVGALRDELSVNTWGTVTRHGLYAPNMLDVLQCDFSCMISEKMFDEFVYPYLTEEASHLDTAEYHLDGPGAIRHLQSIAAIEKIQVIQWQPGAGEAATKDWTQLSKTFDSLGKGQLLKVDKETARNIWQLYRSRQLVLYVNGCSVETINEI